VVRTTLFVLVALILVSACQGVIKNEETDESSASAQQWHSDSTTFAYLINDTVFKLNEARDLAAGWLDSAYTKQHPVQKLYLLRELSRLELTLGHLSQCVSYSRSGIALADSLGIEDERHFLELTKGTAFYRQGRKNSGLPLVSEATRYFVNRKSPRDLGRASYGYGQLMTMLWADDTEQAINAGIQREVTLDALEKISPKDSDFIDQQRGFLYSKMADMMAMLGNAKDGQDYLRKFQSTKFSHTVRGQQAILDYYLSSADYDAFIAHFNDTKDYWKHKDTICSRYFKLLWMMSTAYEKQGNLVKALEYRKRHDDVHMKVTLKENELNDQNASRFENAMQWKVGYVQHKNQQIVKALKLFVTIFLLSIGALLLLTYRNRYQRQENQTLHETVDEQQERYLDLLSKNQKKKPEFTAEMAEKVVLFQELFDKDRIFLEPDLTRTTLEERLGVDKNAFSIILQHAIGEDNNLSNFIATKRIDYACKLMSDFPEYSIKEIAEKSGFYTVRNFRLLFNKQVGVSPQEFKNNLNKQ